jgi:hypothetical protein
VPVKFRRCDYGCSPLRSGEYANHTASGVLSPAGRSSRTHVHSRPFSSCPTLGPTPELACHPRVVSPQPSRGATTLRPVARAAGWIRRPTPPRLSDPTPRLGEHRSAIDDREAQYFDTSACARSPGPAIPRSIGRLGVSACAMRSQHAQGSLGRMC